MEHDEWVKRYDALRAVADRIYALRRERCIAMLRSVGMGMDGCCVHNCSIATVGDGGWGGPRVQTPEERRQSRIRISTCRRVKAIMDDFGPSRVISRWDRRVRGF